MRKDDQGNWQPRYHRYWAQGTPQGASYLYWVDSVPDAQAFERYLAAHPGAVQLWLGGHTHTHPDDTYGGKSHIEQPMGDVLPERLRADPLSCPTHDDADESPPHVRRRESRRARAMLSPYQPIRTPRLVSQGRTHPAAGQTLSLVSTGVTTACHGRPTAGAAQDCQLLAPARESAEFPTSVKEVLAMFEPCHCP